MICFAIFQSDKFIVPGTATWQLLCLLLFYAVNQKSYFHGSRPCPIRGEAEPDSFFIQNGAKNGKA